MQVDRRGLRGLRHTRVEGRGISAVANLIAVRRDDCAAHEAPVERCANEVFSGSQAKYPILTKIISGSESHRQQRALPLPITLTQRIDLHISHWLSVLIN